MLKMMGTGKNGRPTLHIGLSFANLDKFRANPMDTMIKIDGTDIGMGIPIDIVLFSGATEMEMVEAIGSLIGPDTEVRIDPKLKT